MKNIIRIIVLAFFVISLHIMAQPDANTTQLCAAQGETPQQCIQEIQNISLNGNYALNMDVILPTPYTFNPIGTSSQPFVGTFDGQNHIIANLHINATSDYAGMFGINTGTVKNLSLYDVTLSTSHNAVAALVGYNKEGTIQNINLQDITVSSTGDSIASLVGLDNGGSISNCHALAGISVTGHGEVGGLVGGAEVYLVPSASSIKGCSANANVTGEVWVGRLVGSYGDMSSPGVIEESYSEGTVTGTGISSTDQEYGGLVGGIDDGDVTISNCYSRANVSGNDEVGGLVGYFYGSTTPTDSDIKTSYSSGSVTGTSNVGGFLGVIDPSGFVLTGKNYWDTQTSGQATSAGGGNVYGKTTAEMQTQSTFSGWNFTNIWHLYSGDYPVLVAHTKELTLSGTAYLDQGATPVPAGSFVGLYTNGPTGTLRQVALTTSGGKFSFNLDPDELKQGQTFLLYILDPNPEGNAVFVANNNTSDVSGINIFANRVYVYSTTPIDDSTFRTALGTQTNDVLFAICSTGQIKFNVPQLDLNTTDNVNLGGLIGSATDRRTIASLTYLKNWPIPSGKLQMMNSIDLSTVSHPSTP